MKAVLCSSNLTCWGIHLETEDCKRRTGRTGRLLQIIIITAKVRLKIWKWCRKRPSKFFSGLKNLTMRFQNLSLQNLLERRHLSAFQSIFPSICMYRYIKKKPHFIWERLKKEHDWPWYWQQEDIGPIWILYEFPSSRYILSNGILF